MHRRGFFKRFAGMVVGAAAAPAVAKELEGIVFEDYEDRGFWPGHGQRDHQRKATWWHSADYNTDGTVDQFAVLIGDNGKEMKRIYRCAVS